MPTTCAHCGAPLNRPNVRFCPGCGKPVAQSPLPATSLPATQRLTSAQPPQVIIQMAGLPNRVIPLVNLPAVIGSSATQSGVQVQHYAVAPQHLRIDHSGSDFWITDLGSPNGSTINGQRLAPQQPQRLSDGAIIRMGDAQGNSVGIVFRSGVATPTISVQLGKLQLGQSGVARLGRDAANDVHLDHPTVSRFHAEVRRSAKGDILVEHGSNGVFVNGRRVAGQQPLKNHDVVQIGPFKLTYDAGSLSQAGPTDSFRLDAQHLTRRVTGGAAPLAGLMGRRAAARVILNDVSLSIQPREFVALVGASGAGKSTLMKALSGFAPAQGQVLVNGDDLYASFGAYRSILGYVPQEDIIHRLLPVRSALRYAARLRLPDATSAEVEQRVQTVLDQVDMTEHASKQVDSLSGGQRKRVSIACELLAEPGLFFLDEPTSGLDPGMEKKMMYTLRRLADVGRTIILVTHATANIDQCDHVAFMADGRLAYFGPPREALRFFGAPDFADIYTRLSLPLDPQTNPPPAGQRAALAANPAGAPNAAEAWAAAYQNSPQHNLYVEQRLQQTPQAAVGAARPGAPSSAASSKQKDSALRQWGVLSLRSLELIRRDALSLAVLLAVMPIIGLLLVMMTERSDLVGRQVAQIAAMVQDEIDQAWRTEDTASDSDQFQGRYVVAGSTQRVLFILALAANLLGVFAAAYEIVKEEAIYRRERMVNLKLAPYLLSKVSVLALFALIQCLLLLWVLGRKLDYPNEGVFLPAQAELAITLFLAALCGICLGLLISALVRSQNMVVYLVLLTLFVQILFAGAIFELPGAAKALSYITPSRWTLEALGDTVDMPRLNDLSVTCIEPESEQQRMFMGDADPPCEEGQQKLSPTLNFNVEYSHDAGHLLSRWGILLTLAGVFGAATYWVQRRKDVM